MTPRHLLLSTLLLCPAVAALAADDEGAVRVWEEPLTLPTYALGPADKSPVFAERRSYQGADSPVYPYPMSDAISDQRVEKNYKAVFLENRHVQICVLPEIGGRVFAARDKTNGYDFIYRQHVIKPALIGMLGAWISGGIEWNIPHHHRATTFMPVDYAIARNADGSATVRVSELELRHRMRWLVELRLRPDSSCVEQTVRLVNRTPTAHSFLFFANIAVSATGDYQVLFPPDTQWITHHGKREFCRWPVGNAVYNGIDFRGVDASWWKNHQSPVSMFAWGTQMDFVGGYDHGRQAGIVYVADHAISPGKKFFTWGGGEAGKTWDRVLTDKDGPYVELMAGSYSDNQPDYSWIAPYQSKTAESFWYPLTQIGGVSNANRHAAAHLDVRDRVARIGVAVTENRPGLVMRLSSPAGVLLERTADAAPGRPVLAECPAPGGDEPLTLEIRAGGRLLLSYTRQKQPTSPPPEPVRPPAAPDKIAGVEDLYQTGLRLEQLHSAALEAKDYYREALRRDPRHVKANVALGVRAWKGGELAEAERHLQVAVEAAAAGYIVPKDGEPYYYLGLAQRARGKAADARASFERAAWSAGWESPANHQLAEMSCCDGDFGRAVEYLDRALAANADHVKALTLKAAILRRKGAADKARTSLGRAAAVDPLDPWPAIERGLAAGGAAPLNVDRQGALEAATDYAAAGMWAEAVAALQRQDPAAADPMTNYFLAHYLEKLGKSSAAAARYAAAARGSTDYVFPFRREAIEVLRQARRRNPGDARAAWYLGNVLRLHGQLEAAIEQWEQCCALEPTFALAHRTLALAYARRTGGERQAIASLERALQLDRAQPRWCLELDELREAAGEPAEKRLAFFDAHHEVVAKRDDALTREIALRVESGQLDRALKLLGGRTFHIWEGAGRTAVHNSYAEAHLVLGQRAFDAGRLQEALGHFEAALEYPPNLGTGRPERGERLSETHYRLGRTHAALAAADSAAASYAKALAAAPVAPASVGSAVADDPEPRYYAALALQQLRRGDEARAIFQALADSGRARLVDHLPMEFFASFGHPQPPNIRQAQGHYCIGLGLLGLGRPQEARQEFQRALALNPHHFSAKKQIGLLP